MSKKKKKEKEEALQKTSSNKILVKVYKDFGSDTQFLKATYHAEEKRDIYNNLISINKEFKHEEDTDFSMSDVYRSMEITLEFRNFDKDKKLEILKKKIETQEKKVRYLAKYPILNAMFNKCDEELKLQDYRLMANYIQFHDDRGSYFTIEQGVRVYSYNSQDGFLIPVWHGVDTYSQYPDHTRKLKITIQEDQRMRQELAMFKRDKLIGNILVVGLIFNIIFAALLIGASIKVWQMRDNFDARIHELSYKCVQYANQEINKQPNPQPQPKEEVKQLDPEKILNIVG